MVIESQDCLKELQTPEQKSVYVTILIESMIVYRLILTLKRKLRHTKSLCLHVISNSHHRQYQSAFYYRLVFLEKREKLVYINSTSNYVV